MMSRFLIFGLLLTTCSIALASDPSPLQDFCVTDPNSPVFVNGVVYQNAKLVKANDFLFRGFHLMGNTHNDVGSNAVADPGFYFNGVHFRVGPRSGWSSFGSG
ncbi:putative rmlC-like jelly roll protein [Helianthus anomalus]